MERFQAGQKNPEVAAALRVSERPVERWRRAWRERGQAGGCCRRAPRGGLGSARIRSSGWYGSWSAVRRPTGGRTGGGRSLGSLWPTVRPVRLPLANGRGPTAAS
ncbi:helix-turn-helix domain-containing protein [Streptomyces sp. NPDC088354]|uniref:helix-turn-helix domain-containing protein n=1 Tax=Streptomyces sp. NPDC088354 TaxID=3365856 RepID=UPI0037F32235